MISAETSLSLMATKALPILDLKRFLPPPSEEHGQEETEVEIVDLLLEGKPEERRGLGVQSPGSPS
jgi:hypothetical protein